MPISLQKPIFLLLWLLIPLVWFMIRYSFLRHSSLKRKTLVAGLQSLLILVLGLALADPRLMTRSDQVNLLFCLDASESTAPGKRTLITEFMKNAAKEMDEDDQAGLVVFGKEPSLELPLKNEFTLKAIQSNINPNFTNLYSALQFAIGKFPPEGQHKIVLFTDGNENLESASEMAFLAASLGIEIYPVSLTTWFGQNEVFIQNLETPATVPLETPYEIRLAITSSQENRGQLILLRNDQLLMNEEIALKAGKNVLTFADKLPESGLYLYKAVINAPDDVFFQNNEGLSFTRGTRKSQVLYLVNEQQTENPFTETLRIQGLDLVTKEITELTGTLHDLLEYNAIILDNVPGQSLSFAMMENIETYVKDMGGGLLMLGGDKSFGAGYYNNTPIENTLPVFMDVPTDIRISNLCLIFVIDKSSSMATRHSGKSKLDMAKIATFSSIELLNPNDSVGLVAFDWEKQWIVPITTASERQAIANELSRLRESGGTNLYPALEDAFKALQQVDAARKHVIVLSDGRTEKNDFETLVKTMARNDISVSAVAIGVDADKELMQAIAQWGVGRSYYTDDPANIPNIFTGETKIVAKELISERTLQPAPVSAHEVLQGIEYTSFPVILGQVLTYPKPGATVVLSTEKGPLLSAWRYGLGRSIAFTSDLSTRWGKEWVNWDQYGQFSAQMLKWVQRKETQKNYAVEITRQGEQGTFTADVTDSQHRFINHLALKLNILSTSQTNQTLSLEQIAPGRYQAAFPAEDIGEYYFSLFGDEDDEQTDPKVFGFGVPYTDEFTSVGVNTPLLDQLASMTNGQVLQLDEVPKDLFTVQSDIKDYGTSLWPYLAIAFLLLLLGNVAVRKFVNPMS